MPSTRKPKSSSKPAKKASRRSEPVDKRLKATAPVLKKKSPVRKPQASKPRKIQPIDLSAFPPESISVLERWICLACVSDVFQRHMDLTARAAHREIKRYTPSISELYAPTVMRPWFINRATQNSCPYCGSTSKWLARLYVYRIESGKATDALRRELLKSLPRSHDEFVVLEEKATQQHAFFEWLDKISTGLDLDNPVWLRDVSRHYLSRKEPKTDWESVFGEIHAIRRSRRLEDGWEVDSGRLFLAPILFDELLLVQYLLSRSHRAGGLTLEGRYTLHELFIRLRNAGYLRAVGIDTQNPDDAFEQLVTHLGGGDAAIKFYHIIDRRDFLETLKRL